MTEALVFDFITDGRFRAALQSDAREMENCLENGAWKAVHVLGGSIVEAVLVDHLVSVGTKSPDPLKMDLADLIRECQSLGVLSQKTAELSSALKSYRNLIHPGRAIRLEERVDADGATVVRSLVAIIVREVAAKRQQDQGLTAEQILRKIETDPSALGIAKHLLSGAKADEIRRLIVDLLPDHYFRRSQEDEEPDQAVLDRLATLYRSAFVSASDQVKRAAMKRYVSVLKEEVGELVTIYEEEFFRASDLEFASSNDRKVIKDHLFARLAEGPTLGLISAGDGIGVFLEPTPADVNPFVDPFVRAAVRGGARGKGRTSTAAERVLPYERRSRRLRAYAP